VCINLGMITVVRKVPQNVNQHTYICCF